MSTTTVEVKITVTEDDARPGTIGIHVEGPENILLLLGIIEMAKVRVLQPQPSPVRSVPGIDLKKLRLHQS